MYRRFTIVAVAVLMFTIAVAAVAKPPSYSPADPRWQEARVDGGRVGVVIELADEPTATTFARALGAPPAVKPLAANVELQANAAAANQLALVEAAQQGLLPAIEGPGIGAEVIYRLQRAYNGIAAYVDPSRIEDIARLPGVKSIHPLVPAKLMTSTSVPFIGSPQVWQGAGVSATGTGVSIGIIDSGIDYLHKDFGGTGVYTGQNFADNTVPWTTKVVGGKDFAGDAYTGSNTPKPDGDPMDCASNGHGTHVAGIAAGYGVDADGNRYPGPYGPNQDYSLFMIGPGVAPGARLYAIRVFGCSNSSGIITQGIEWALDPNGDGNLSDHLDVINLSVGSPFGRTNDVLAVAADNAVAAGVVVAAAAGNEYDTTFAVASPGAAPRVISVAATGDAGTRGATLDVTSPPEIAREYEATAAAFGGTTPPDGLSGAVALASPADACSAVTNTGEIAGKLALINRGNCTFVSKVKNAQNAGAVGVIVTDHTAQDLIIMAGVDPTITIPAVFISLADGNTLKGKLPSPGVTANVALLSGAGLVTSFSSRGPVYNDGTLKPDLAAPGDFVTSARARAAAGDPLGATFIGTSMSAPHVAGAMALLKQIHPTWTPPELKALAMNTGADTYSQPNQSPPIHSPMRVGGGLIDLPAAAAATAIAYDAANPDVVSVSFGAFEVPDTASFTRTIKVENRGLTDRTFAIGYTATSDVTGVDISFPEGASVAVPAGGSATFTVRLDAVASAMKHDVDPAADATQDGVPRHLQAEEAGYVTLTPEGGGALRVPIYAAARPVAAIATLETGLILGASDGTLTMNLTGTGLDSGPDHPRDIVSLMSPLELQYVGPSSAPPSTRTATVRYAGVASDYLAEGGGSLPATTLEFGVATLGDWKTFNEVEFTVTVDRNRDGADDYRLITTDSYTFADSESTPSDAWGVKLCPTGGSCTWAGPVNRFSAAERDTAMFGTNVAVIAIPASAVGVTGAFDYRVRASNWSLGEVTATPKLTYDPTKPGLAPLSGWLGPTPAQPGDRLLLAYDRASYASNDSQGLLLLHHHNASGNRAQVLPVTAADCTLACAGRSDSTVTVSSQAGFSVLSVTETCGPVTFAWDFGDGSAHGSGTATTHAYSEPGTYTWQLTGNASGITCLDTGTITVTPASTARPPRRRTVRSGLE